MVINSQSEEGYDIFRALLLFDTSHLHKVESAYISILVKDKHEIDNSDKIIIQNGQPAYPHDPFELGDYDYEYYSGNGGELDGYGIVAYEWNNIVLNETGISWINCGGTTKLVLRSLRDIETYDPGTLEYVVSNSPPLLYVTEEPLPRSFGTIIG